MLCGKKDQKYLSFWVLLLINQNKDQLLKLLFYFIYFIHSVCQVGDLFVLFSIFFSGFELLDPSVIKSYSI